MKSIITNFFVTSMKVDKKKREPYFKFDLLRKMIKAVPEGDVKTYLKLTLESTLKIKNDVSSFSNANERQIF